MSIAWSRVAIGFRDYGGLVAKVSLTLAAAVVDPAGSVVQALKTALDAASECSLYRSSVAQTDASLGGGSFGSGNFNKVEDRVVLTFQGTLDDSYGRIEIPAPKEAICVANSSDVLLTATAMAQLLTDVPTYACTLEGDLLNELTSAIRTEKKLEKF